MSERRLIGDPILHEVMPKAEFNDELRQIAEEVVQHSREWEDSVGLAANQIGHRARLFVVKLDGKIDVFVNPSVIRSSYTMQGEVEGCGSIPDRTFFVRRPLTIVGRWYTLEGKLKAEQMHGMRARVFQHELDHLNGVLISDHGIEQSAAA